MKTIDYNWQNKEINNNNNNNNNTGSNNGINDADDEKNCQDQDPD